MERLADAGQQKDASEFDSQEFHVGPVEFGASFAWHAYTVLGWVDYVPRAQYTAALVLACVHLISEGDSYSPLLERSLARIPRVQVMFELQHSKAYDNTFFRCAGGALLPGGAGRLVREWFPITQGFCQSVAVYCAHLVEEVRCMHGALRSRSEAALLTPLAIAAEEFGLGRRGVDAIHYRMFARLGEPLGLTLEDLREDVTNLMPETRTLLAGIEAAMQDVHAGAACLRVVEATAYNIVEAFDKVFRPLRSRDGASLYSDYQLEYITLHLELEKEHDSMSAEFITSLCNSRQDEVQISTGIDQMCALFGDYWEAMARAIFQMPTAKPRTCC